MENYNIPKEISTELKINKSLYLFDLLFIIGLLMVTMMSYTKTYEAVSSNITGTVTIENRVYHPATNSLDMVIKMDQTDEEEVSFLAQEKANPNIKLPVHLLYEDDGYYVVRVSELSPNWEALAFDLYQENEEKETVNVDDVTRDSETDSTEEIDAHALITTLYSDQ